MPVNYRTPAADQLAPVAGVRLGVAAAGIRKPDRNDLTLVALAATARVAAVFTKNRFAAAPVQVCRQHLPGGDIRALIINTGVANAGVGAAGLAAARQSCAAVARLMDLRAEQVLPFSTGVIMEPLPLERLKAGLPACLANLRDNGWSDAASAIMTTDTVAKAASRRLDINGQAVVITGVAKGSGMIHPDMATMLGFLLVASAPTEGLPGLLREVADRTFHRVTVDGDTSPNDSLFLLAGATGTASRDAAQASLTAVGTQLSRQLAADGEGASRLMTIEVRGAATEADAAQVGRVIATSPLVKTAVAGRDPNWGRILSAAGRAGVPFPAERALVKVGSSVVFADGRPHPANESAAARYLADEAEVMLSIDLAAGKASADVWTCDFTAEYVSINADYRT